MLPISLQHLSWTTQAASLDLRIFLDHSNDDKLNAVRLSDTEYVRDTYFPTAEIFHANNHILTPGGCWNILHSLKSGYDTNAEFVFFVEEDIFIVPEFFDRHLELHA